MANHLFDAFGRPMESPPQKPETEMLGSVRIRDQWTTYPSTSLTPEKLVSIMREADSGDVLRQAELAEEMEEKDPDLSSLLHTRKLAVQGLDPEIVPASDSPEDKKIAEHVRENLDDLDLDDPVLDLLDAIFKGFATVEINWEVQGKVNWVSGLEWIHQKRWTFSEFDADFEQPIPKVPRLITKEEPFRGIEIPPFKFIYHRYKGRSGLPQRGGLFRPVSFYYLFKNYDIKDWVIFIEKYGQPLRVGKFSPGAGEDDKKVLKEAIQNLGTDAGALISDTTEINIIESKTTGTSMNIYDRFAEFVNKSYAKAILGQTATTEGTPGKLGGEEARSEVRHDLTRADAKVLSKTIKSQLVWPMVGFNFGWDKPLPHVRFPVEPPEDLVKLSLTHKTLVEVGMPIGVNFARKKYGIPEPQKDEEILQPPTSAAPSFNTLSFREGDGIKKKALIPVGGSMLPSEE